MLGQVPAHDGVEQGHVGPSDGRVTDSGVERHPGHKQSLSIQRLSERNGKTSSIRNFHLRNTGEDTWPRTQAFLHSFFFCSHGKKCGWCLNHAFAMAVKAFAMATKKTVREVKPGYETRRC